MNDEIFQETSLRMIVSKKKETGSISKKIEAKGKELLQNQAEHKELLTELSKQNGDTQKIATLVLREIKNEFLKNTTNGNNESGNSFHDENITRSTIKNLWKNLQKNLSVIQCKNLAKEVSQMLQTMQRNKNISGITAISVTLQEITQLFLEEAENTQWEKAETDWKQQKKELEKLFAAQEFADKELTEEDDPDINGEKLTTDNLQEKFGEKNTLESFLKSLEELSPENRWKIAEKILGNINSQDISGISPNNLEELTDYIASVDKDFARKINLENLLSAEEKKNADKTNTLMSKISRGSSFVVGFFKKIFKSKLFWLLLLFLMLVVCFFVVMDEKNQLYESFIFNNIFKKF